MPSDPVPIPPIFNGRLHRTERAVWSGRPSGGVFLRLVDLYLIPLSLLWSAMVVLIFGGLLTTGQATPLSAVFAALFISFAIFSAVGRFALDWWLRRHTFYLITDRRVLIARDRPFSTVRSVQIGLIPVLEILDRPRGRGTIRLGSQPFWTAQWGYWVPSLASVPTLLGIENARQVFDMLRDMEAGKQDALTG